jgi:GT2 family glycosyltransferase
VRPLESKIMSYAASIVIPVLNQVDDWLRMCVHSALAQSVPCEVLVVLSPRTGPSNREVLDGIGAGERALRVLKREDPTFANALNTGIAAAATERIGFLLSDDWLEATAVEECLPFSTDIVSSGLTNYAADGTTLLGVEKRRSQSAFDSMATLEEKASYLSHFFMFKSKALQDVGGVDDSIGLTGADDYDLIWTLLERGATVTVLDRILYHRRDHDGERLTLRSRDEQVKDLVKILDKHGVFGSERQRLIERHAGWYGAPVHVVVARKAREAANRRQAEDNSLHASSVAGRSPKGQRGAND